MTTAKIKLTEISDVKDFVNIISRCPYDADIVSGRYAIDAKSIMGIFSLDLSKDMELKIHNDDCGEFLDELSKFIVG